jgi:dTDP-4-amino-4,6-dideoxygalactose transaminase
MVNAVPVLVDVEFGTGCIDPAAVEAAITPRTRAVIAVHIAGHPADMDALSTICKKHGLALIEDCAHAHGSSWNNKPVGTLGDAGSYSFQSSKLMTGGEGGAVIARDPAVAAKVRSFSDCGRRPGEWFYSHYALGGNYRMTEWQGAILLAQLSRFGVQQTIRASNANLLNEELALIPGVHPMLSLLRTAFATVLVASALPASALTPVATPLLDNGQMIVVTTDGWDATQGRLQAYARTAQGWQPHGGVAGTAVYRSWISERKGCQESETHETWCQAMTRKTCAF